MSQYMNSTIKLSALFLTCTLITACSISPLACQRMIPRPKAPEQLHAPITAIPAPAKTVRVKSTKTVKLPYFTEIPTMMTLTARKANTLAIANGHYNFSVKTEHVSGILAVQPHSLNHYVVTINEGALPSFWKMANPYFTGPYQYAVISTGHLPTQIVKVDKVIFNAGKVTYSIISENALPLGDLKDVTITVEN